jgi:hypothetical protein
MVKEKRRKAKGIKRKEVRAKEKVASTSKKKQVRKGKEKRDRNMQKNKKEVMHQSSVGDCDETVYCYFAKQ